MLVRTQNPFHGSKFIYTSLAESSGTPQDYDLLTNYPNPFNPETRIRYRISTPGNIRLLICNVRGETLKTIDHGYRSRGYHELSFNAKGLNSGVYFCILQRDDKYLNSKR
ncbi:MAG: T9SS type A sorting domain-containing protein [Candidatus Marinimicrobia bacterium]|nr:T9SS type A sorting domain-containing protein [Candidatus Neomarinimicrobiota bacterium]